MDIQQIKEYLQQEKEKINQELSQFAEKSEKIKTDFNSRFPNWGDDVDSNAAEVEDYSSRLGVEKSLEQDLLKIDKALQKIEQGNYGICEECGQKISPERLEAMPAALYCIKCQAKHS